jgi:ribosomal protein S18 acetylase RimI-like enzyme
MLGAGLDLEVRRARVGDAPRLADVFRDSWRATYRGVIPHTHLENMIRRRGPARWRNAIRSGEMILVIEFDGEIVGYATCGTTRSRCAHKGEIYEIYLLPDFQGLGFGEFLFEACRFRLDQRRLPGLIVWALAENSQAVNFYWHLGGRPMVSAYERIGGVRLEKIAFTWD